MQDDDQLRGKIALVTGGSRGIGRAIAEALARAGATVVVCSRNLDSNKDTAEQIRSRGGLAYPYRVDVTDGDSVSALVSDVLKDFGRIDILVNNAGVAADNLLLRLKEADWDKVIDTNLKGTFNCTKAVARTMVKQRGGKIINIASVVGITGNPGQANYCASKAGIIGLTKSVARELASRNITVNCVAPGLIRTAMTDALPDEAKDDVLRLIPLGRMGEPEDVAEIVKFLASPASDYITGEVIRADGGMAM
ncbi:MAG: 3-oxoacyl-[acyl-carrier-protein] reductase [Candidatus Hydrogenedentota bacterium]|nr:MAG: 3-oxoacyl-[acyl-carrier-protein] reductase [Candidatus Hydrogenedentota bacterium]